MRTAKTKKEKEERRKALEAFHERYADGYDGHVDDFLREKHAGVEAENRTAEENRKKREYVKRKAKSAAHI